MQCDRIGPFLKDFLKRSLLVTFGDFWVILKNRTFQFKTSVDSFLGNFWKNWTAFNFNIWSHWPPANLKLYSN